MVKIILEPKSEESTYIGDWILNIQQSLMNSKKENDLKFGFGWLRREQFGALFQTPQAFAILRLILSWGIDVHGLHDSFL